MTAKMFPVRATRRASMGSFNGMLAGTGSVRSGKPWSSWSSRSTDAMPGVVGVSGVGGMTRPSWLEAESALRSEGRFSSNCGGGGDGKPSWDTTRLKLAVWLLLVA